MATALITAVASVWLVPPATRFPPDRSSLDSAERRDTEQPEVCPTDENRVQHQPRDDGDGVVEASGRSRAQFMVPLLQGDAIHHRPCQKTAEQQHVGQHAIGEQMPKGPEFYSGQHRMLGSRVDSSRHIRSYQQWE